MKAELASTQFEYLIRQVDDHIPDFLSASYVFKSFADFFQGVSSVDKGFELPCFQQLFHVGQTSLDVKRNGKKIRLIFIYKLFIISQSWLYLSICYLCFKEILISEAENYGFNSLNKIWYFWKVELKRYVLQNPTNFVWNSRCLRKWFL